MCGTWTKTTDSTPPRGRCLYGPSLTTYVTYAGGRAVTSTFSGWKAVGRCHSLCPQCVSCQVCVGGAVEINNNPTLCPRVQVLRQSLTLKDDVISTSVCLWKDYNMKKSRNLAALPWVEMKKQRLCMVLRWFVNSVQITLDQKYNNSNILSLV